MEHPWALSELLSLSLQAETWDEQLHSTELTQQGSESSYLLHEQEGRFVWRQLTPFGYLEMGNLNAFAVGLFGGGSYST